MVALKPEVKVLFSWGSIFRYQRPYFSHERGAFVSCRSPVRQAKVLVFQDQPKIGNPSLIGPLDDTSPEATIVSPVRAVYRSKCEDSANPFLRKTARLSRVAGCSALCKRPVPSFDQRIRSKLNIGRAPEQSRDTVAAE